MAMDEVLATISSRLQDGSTGLAAKAVARVAARGLPVGSIKTNFFFEEWLLSGDVRPSTQPQIAVRPRSWRPEWKAFTTLPRKADVVVEVAAECVAATQVELENWATIVATALLQCIDTLAEWSSTHAGTIKLVRDPVDLTFGSFDGAPTQGGFLAVITLLEESYT